MVEADEDLGGTVDSVTTGAVVEGEGKMLAEVTSGTEDDSGVGGVDGSTKEASDSVGNAEDATVDDGVAEDIVVGVSSELENEVAVAEIVLAATFSAGVNGAAALGAATSSKMVTWASAGLPLLSSTTFSHILATCGSTNSMRCSLRKIKSSFNAALKRFQRGMAYGFAVW